MIIGTTLIALTWALFIGLGLPTWAGAIITVVCAFLILFGLLFTVYFFNLDSNFLCLCRNSCNVSTTSAREIVISSNI